MPRPSDWRRALLACASDPIATGFIVALTMIQGCDLWVGSPDTCGDNPNLTRHFIDADGDKLGDPDRPLNCERIVDDLVYIDNDDDCNDDDATVGKATVWYADPDQDGYAGDDIDCTEADDGSLSGSDCEAACTAPEGFTADTHGDCDPDNDLFSVICPWTSVCTGKAHSCGIRADGTIECWGGDSDGQSQAPDGNDFTVVTCGGEHSCGLHGPTGTVECWGNDDDGQSTTQLAGMGEPTRVYFDVDAGETYTCGLYSEDGAQDIGRLECWGGGDARQFATLPEHDDFVSLDAGPNRICAAREGGQVECVVIYSDGYDEIYEGDFTEADAADWLVDEMAVGWSHACGLEWSDDDMPRDVLCAGDISDTGTRPQVAEFCSVAAGRNHTCALSATDVGSSCSEQSETSLACWGENPYTDYAKDDIPDLSDLRTIDSFIHHTCGVRSTGQLACWGANYVGQSTPPGTFRSIGTTPLGTCGSAPTGYACWGEPDEVPQLWPRMVDVSAARTHTCGVYASGLVQCWGSDDSDRSTPPSELDFTHVSVGTRHSCALHEDGRISCWGANEQHRVSGAPDGDGFVKVSAADKHSCALHEDGSVTCWGQGDERITDQIRLFIDVSAGDQHSCGVLESGELHCWGIDSVAAATPPSDSEFATVSSGDNFACALRQWGDVVCFGEWSVGLEDGVGPDLASLSFASISSGEGFACGVQVSGALTCWDQDDVWDDVPSGHDFTAVESGWDHVCAIRDNSETECWGLSDFGQSDLAVLGELSQIEGGQGFVCLLDESGQARCAGENSSGQSVVPDSRLTKLSVGRWHACGLKEGGGVVCWGDNSEGQLTLPRGTDLSAALDVTAGYGHSCVLLPDDSNVCWGDNNMGQAPPSLDGTSSEDGSGGATDVGTDDATDVGTLFGTDDATGSDLAEGCASYSGDGVQPSITAGTHHTCSLASDGRVSCWGDDSLGQLSTIPNCHFSRIAAGGWHTCGLVLSDADNEAATISDDTGRKVMCWGADTHGQSSDEPIYLFTDIKLGDEHSCGLKPDGLLACWGRNLEGQLDAPSPTEL